MSRTIERLNDLTSALGESIQPHDIRELRLTGQQDVRQFPAVGRWAAGRWAIPVLAAASVLVLAVAVTVLGQLSSRSTSTSLAGPPRFLVISEDGQGYVKLAATGRTIAKIPPPVKGYFILGIAAQPGDRVFYLVGTTTPARGGKTSFFQVKLGPDGHPRPLRRLSVPSVSVPPPITNIRLENVPIAVSPDGTEIAYTWPVPLLGLPIAPSTKIFVRNLATGAVRVWSVPNNGRTEISDLSWAVDGKLSYVATIGGATVRNGFVVSDRHHDLTVLAILDTLRPAGQLLAASLITYSSESVSTSGVVVGPFNGVVAAVIAPGGRIVIARLFVRDQINELAELSAATGKVLRVLFSGRAPFQADPITVDGDHVLLRLNLRNEPNGNSICWRLATANLGRGRISYLPLPTFCSVQAPPPLGGSW